jgi:hypothetical protein
MAPTGAVVNQAGLLGVGGVTQDAGERREARMLGRERRISTSAAAPSEIELELAAVTVPSSRKAGLSCGILSKLALNGCSSMATIEFSPCGTSP